MLFRTGKPVILSGAMPLICPVATFLFAGDFVPATNRVYRPIQISLVAVSYE
jgi:hypothetical protein